MYHSTKPIASFIRMSKSIAILIGALAIAAPSILNAQTNPSPHSLSTSDYTFTGFASGTTVAYPTSMNGVSFAAEPSAVTANLANDANGDRVLVASSSGITTGSIRNEIGNGLSLLNSGSNNIGAIVVALNSSGRSSLTATWTAEQLNTASASRVLALSLQYRIGTTGTFTTVAGSQYLCTIGSLAAAQTFSSIALPAACDNKPIVHLRWIYYTNSGSGGSRDRIRLDDITVSSSPASIPNIVTSLTTLPYVFAPIGSASSAVSYTVEGTNLTGNIVVTPPVGVELSTTSGVAGFVYNTGSPLSLTPTTGTVTPTTIWARLSTSATGLVNTNITHISPAASQPVQFNGQAFGNPVAVINQAYNASGNTEWVEIITIQNNLNMQGWKYKDYTGSSPNNANELTFVSNPLWNNIPAGSIIVIYHPNNFDVEDLSFADDGVVKVQACNTTFFSQAASPCTNNTIALNASQDAAVLYNSSSAFVHAIEYSTTTEFNPAVFSPKGYITLASALSGSGESVQFSNTSSITDFYNSANVSRTSTVTQGLSNDATQKTYICGTLRGTTQPNSPASGLALGSVSDVQIQLNWTPGNGARRIVICRPTANSAVAPVDGIFYDANTDFGTPLSTTGTNNNVVFQGNGGGTVTVTGLIPSTSYSFDIYEYNGIGECIDYLTTPASFVQTTNAGSTVSINAITGSPFCISNTSLSANFNASINIIGSFLGGNIFNVQLSDAAGSFTSPTNIGSGTTATIACTIPAGTIAGSGYLVRVVSTNPVRISNSENLEIISAPVNVTSPSATPGSTLATISWTNPTAPLCYNDIMIVAKAGAFTSAVPTGNAYINNSNSFTDAINSNFDGGKVVYRGNTSPQVITSLTNSTTYNFKIFTRVGNDWSSGVTVSAIPAFVLSPGDIQIIGFNSSNPDGFSWVTWTAIPAGTQINFTDCAFNGTGSAYAAGNYRGTENTVTWTAPAGGIPVGRVIVMLDNGSGTTVTGGGTATSALNGLSGSGDQIFAFTGAIPASSTSTNFTGNLIYGLTFGNSWLSTGTTSTTTSYLPSELSAANANMAYSSGVNAEYTAPRNNQTTYPAYKPQVSNSASNWTTNGANTVLNATSFTLSLGLPPVNLTVSTSNGFESASTVVTLTATVTGVLASSETIQVSVSGTGITAADYSLSNATITIPAGTNPTGTVTFTILNDVAAEGIETAIISLGSPSAGIQLGANTVRTVTINDNDIPNLVITEIMYNTPGTDNEWIEIHNPSLTSSVVINNLYTLSGSNPSFSYTFTGTTTILPNHYITVQIGNNGSFPFTPTVVAFATGTDRLSNASSTITLSFNSLSVDVVSYSSSAPWPIDANGNGPSLMLNTPGLDNNIGSNWGACLPGGTPNQININCSSTVYYSVASGMSDGQIWSTSPTGPPIYASFAAGIDLIIQDPHVVQLNNTSAIPVRNLTINQGSAKLWRNSSVIGDMKYFDVYGNITNNGIIGNGVVFDAIGFNIEGASCNFSGVGITNVGRLRKNTGTVGTTNLTINTAVNSRYPGTAIYNNGTNSLFNINIATGKSLQIFGDGSTPGDLSIDGVNGQSVLESGGIITVNGTLRVSGTFYALTNNVNGAIIPGIVINSTGRVSARDIDMRIDGSFDVGFSTTIATGGQLIVTGVLRQREGTLVTNGGLILNSSASLLHGIGTPGMGTNPGGSVTGNVLVRRNGDTGPAIYNYWSSPVSGATLLSIGVNGLSTGSASNTYEYNPAGATGSDVAGLRQGWILRNFNTPMVVGKGYITTSAGNVAFTGPVNNGNINRPLTLGAFTRFNLVGNPYPCAISAGAFISANSSQIEPALYFWDDDASGGVGYDVGDYAVTNTIGTVATGGSGNASSFTGDIASGQGFFVEALSTGSSVAFTNSMRNSNNAFFFESEDLSRLWVSVKNDVGVYNEVLLAFLDGATDGKDANYDAKKLIGNDNLALYTLIDGDPYSIQTWGKLTENRIVPLGLNAAVVGSHTFSLKQLDNIDPTVLIYLEDQTTGIFHNLRLSDYTFSIDEAIEGSNRFFLHFSKPIGIEAISESCSLNDGAISIEGTTSTWNYDILNSQNVSISHGSLNQDGFTLEDLNAGVYAIQLSTADGYSTTINVEINGSQAIYASVEGQSSTSVNQEATFVSINQGATSLSWDFGDGSANATGSVVNHSFTSPGIYTVTLFANNQQCSTQSTFEVRVVDGITGINGLSVNGIKVFPNPANEKITILSEGSVNVEIADLTGKILRRMSTNNEKVSTIETSSLANGIYLVSLIQDGIRSTKRIVIAH
jgi:hypothetical protein